MAVRYGFIGCGAIAQRRHLPEAAANPNSKLAALADPMADRVNALATQYGAKAYTDYKEMLAERGYRCGGRGRAQCLHAAAEHRGAQRRQARAVRKADGHHPRRRQGDDRRGGEEQEVPDDRPESAADAAACQGQGDSQQRASSARCCRSAPPSSIPAPRGGRSMPARAGSSKRAQAFMGVSRRPGRPQGRSAALAARPGIHRSRRLHHHPRQARSARASSSTSTTTPTSRSRPPAASSAA